MRCSSGAEGASGETRLCALKTGGQEEGPKIKEGPTEI